VHKTTGTKAKEETTAAKRNTGKMTGIRIDRLIMSGGNEKMEIAIIEITKVVTIAMNTVRNILKGMVTHNGTITIIPNMAGFIAGSIVTRWSLNIHAAIITIQTIIFTGITMESGIAG